jgi:hypothetical protein
LEKGRPSIQEKPVRGACRKRADVDTYSRPMFWNRPENSANVKESKEQEKSAAHEDVFQNPHKSPSFAKKCIPENSLDENAAEISTRS